MHSLLISSSFSRKYFNNDYFFIAFEISNSMKGKHLSNLIIIFCIIAFTNGILCVSAITNENGLNNVGSNSSLLNLDEIELSIPNVQSSDVVIDGIITTNEYFTSYLETDTGIHIYWEHNELNLKVGLIAPGTGWVSLGIGDEMLDANMILGGFDNGSPYIRDLVGIASHGHANDTSEGGSYDIISYGSSENATSSTLEFEIPLNSSDLNDTVLEIGVSYTFFVGFSLSDDDPTSFHTGGYSLLSVFIDDDDNPDNNQPVLEIGDFDLSVPFVNDTKVIIDGSIGDSEYKESFTDKKTGIEVSWEHNGEQILFGLHSPGLGWVALGIGEAMLGSTMILGGVDGGQPYIVDLNGLADWVHYEDEVSNILSFAASEDQDGTILEFSLPFNPQDDLDPQLEVGKVYGMFLGLQLSSDEITQIHSSHSDILNVLIRPEAITIPTELEMEGSVNLDLNETIYLGITLKSGGLPREGVPIDFFMVTQFGELLLETVITDINGKANISYWNPNLINEHIFGARSEEVLFIENGEIKVLESSVYMFTINFEEIIEVVEPFLGPSRFGILVMFWLAGALIWGSFFYCFWMMFVIFKDRNAVISQEDIQEEDK